LADISDLTAYLKATAITAVYPNGTSQPSVAAIDCVIEEGWPEPAQLDLDIQGLEKTAAGTTIPRPGGVCAHISVFPPPGTGVQVYQILNKTYVIAPAAITSTVEVAGDVVTVTGPLAAGEFLTLVLDNAVICSQTGANVAAMLAALAAQAVAAGYAATATATTLTVPFKFEMTVRQGGKAILGKVTHRQRQAVMVTVWAPTPETRTTLAKAIDGLIKQANKITVPADGSQALVIYSRTTVLDLQESVGIYRRDLVYEVEYATVEQFPGFTITSTTVSIASPDNSAVALAIE
jgi:hypothetical protein